MGRKAQIAIVVVLLLLIGGAVAAYAVDSSHEDEIADGIRIGDVDVGGMSPEEARADVRADLIKPLDKPVTVTYADTKYVLSPEQLNVHADINGMVDVLLRGDFDVTQEQQRKFLALIAESAQQLTDLPDQLEKLDRPAQFGQLRSGPEVRVGRARHSLA